MRGPKSCLILVVVSAFACLLVAPRPALAYVGPGPGAEFIPLFYSMLVLVGTMFSAVLLWPIQAMMRRLRGVRRAPAAAGARAADSGTAAA
jgi:hypothetical protein